GNLAKGARFPLSHRAGYGSSPPEGAKTKPERKWGRGKVEIQKQDSHFPTAPTACGARRKNPSSQKCGLTGRITLLHKADRSRINKTGQLDLLTTVDRIHPLTSWQRKRTG